MATATNTMGQHTNTLLNAYQAWGTDVEGLTNDEALQATGLAGWQQHLLEPLLMDEHGTYDPGTRRYNAATIPGMGNVVLGAVTTAYRPVQHEELMPLLDALTGVAGFTPVTMGAYDQGRRMFALYATPGGKERTVGGDPLEQYLLVAKRNDGTGSIQGIPVGTRVRCANEISSVARVKRAVVKLQHSKRVDTALAQAKHLAELTVDWDAALAAEVERLQGQRLTKRQYERNIVPVALQRPRPDDKGASQTAWDRRFDQLMAAWDSPNAPERSTAWRAWNAVSEWEQHLQRDDQDALAEKVLRGDQPASRAVLAVL